MRLKVGDRVQIIDGEWSPGGATGVITRTKRIPCGGGLRAQLNSLWRSVLGHGPVLIRFDEPQIDEDDEDGVFYAAAVPRSALTRLP